MTMAETINFNEVVFQFVLMNPLIDSHITVKVLEDSKYQVWIPLKDEVISYIGLPNGLFDLYDNGTLMESDLTAVELMDRITTYFVYKFKVSLTVM